MNLFTFLDSNKSDNTIFTHTSMCGGKWDISDDKYDEFFRYYCEELIKGREMYLTEKHLNDRGPIYIDFDIRYDKMYESSPILLDIISKIVSNLTKVLKKCLSSKANYLCYVLKRPGVYYSNNKYKDGIHICFPFLVTTFDYQYALRNYYIERYMKDDFKDIPHYPNLEKNELKEIYDKSVIERNNWCMYGSTKKGVAPYRIIKVYNGKAGKIETLELISILSIRNKKELTRTHKRSYNKLIKTYMKNINKKTDTKTIETEKESETSEIDKKILNQLGNRLEGTEIGRILNILSQDRCDKFDKWIRVGMILFNYGEEMGCLYLEEWKTWSMRSINYEEGCCEKYWGKMKYRANGLNIGTLYYYAKKDNIEEYKKLFVRNIIMDRKGLFSGENEFSLGKIIKNFEGYNAMVENNYCPIQNECHEYPKCYIALDDKGMILRCCDGKCFGLTHPADRRIQLTNNQFNYLFNVNININNTVNNYNSGDDEYTFIDQSIEVFEDKKLNSLVLESIGGAHFDIARLLHYLFKNEFCCTEDGDWYHYRKHKWSKSKRIGRYICVELIKYYHVLLKESEKKASLNKYKNQISKLIIKLKDKNFKHSLLVEAGEYFHIEDENFIHKLDANRMLIGFTNGVYDLENDEFRNGRYDDYISMDVGYAYKDDSENREEIMKVISEILPNKNVRDYLLKLFSLCLTGQTISKCFLLNGCGSNGKSLLVNFLKYTLGSYVCRVPIALITKKRQNSEAAMPNLTRAKKSRCIVFSEPNKKDILNAGVIKELTGCEDITVRGLYKSPEEYRPMFKVFILCNFLPNVEEDDYGIWRRIRSIKFKSKFVDNPTKDNEYKIDLSLNEKIKEWRCGFMNILLDYYKIYRKEGLKDIKEITEETKKYRVSNDPYQEFIDECIELDENGSIVWIEFGTRIVIIQMQLRKRRSKRCL